jgi:hypothetical protein
MNPAPTDFIVGEGFIPIGANLGNTRTLDIKSWALSSGSKDRAMCLSVRKVFAMVYWAESELTANS